MKWPVLCGLLGLALLRPLMGADTYYTNNAVVNYPVNVAYPPVIDAVNFLNNNTFTIDFTTLTYSEFYQTSDTINYTNIGTMSANTGFNFDTRSAASGLHSMAGNFLNRGTINCGLGNTTGTVFGYGGLLFTYYSTAGQFNAWASNIENPGTVNVGSLGLLRFTGDNVNLSRSKLLMQSAGAYVSGSGISGLNTNTWDPSTFLRPNFVDSAYIPVAAGAYIWPPGFGFGYLELTNSTAYIQVDAGVSNNIVRAVFLQDDSGSNVSHNVYFHSANPLVGNGSVTIEWRGFYQDVMSGNYLTNFVYLNNDYLESVSTNIFFVNGVPDNLTITESTTPQIFGLTPAPAGYANVFLPGSITNRYSYGYVQLVSTTADTNSTPDHSLTNTPGRIQITASKKLDLSLAEISGANYLSLRATNQFDGNKGAHIAVPYSDLNLGVTNGFLTISNLLVTHIPNWSGEMDAWSTRWLAVDATGVTNDYRVLIVGAKLNPVTIAQVQDLILHSTNSLVVSDMLNVSRNFTSDAQNLTLTTNGPGVGAGSLDGELNLSSGSIFWETALPNLRNLTNSGAIRTDNQANFGGPLASNIQTNLPAVAAGATLSKSSASVVNLQNTDKLLIGSTSYRYLFASTLTNTVANQVKIAPTFDGTMSNLIAAINGAPGSGTNYSSATTSNSLVVAGSLVNHAFTVSARIPGTNGNNNIVLTVSTNNIVWSTNNVAINGNTYGTLTGGAEGKLGSSNVVSFPYDNFINSGLLADQGALVWAQNFVNSGAVSNGVGSFVLQSLTTTMTNSVLTADGDISITADSLVTSNLVLHAGRSLTLWATNQIVDGGPATNGNIWSVGELSAGLGLNVPIKPAVGTLLGTTITNIAPTNTSSVVNIWPGTDFGLVGAGYTNNMAIGRLILDPIASTISGQNGSFVFNGQGIPGKTNALYVDLLELRDFASTNVGPVSPYDFSAWLTINTNLIIYFAEAVQNGQSVAQKIDDAGRFQNCNNGRLRWIPTYNGYFSSTNFMYPVGVTNFLNAAALKVVDSDGDGIPNFYDTTPFFQPSQMNFTVTVTNVPPLSVRVQWATIPNATNAIFYTTNLLGGTWQPFTNFNSFYWSTNVAVAHSAALLNTFVSPNLTDPLGSPATNVWVFDVVTDVPHYYRVSVQPNMMYPY